MPSDPTAVIADDEQPLRTYLKSCLCRIWPQLILVGEAADGQAALKLIRKTQPDIAFLDIKMPGLSGLDVARAVSKDCWIVFITAYDQYAVAAFENEAVDYLLKPVTAARLEKTLERLRRKLAIRKKPPEAFSALLEKLAARLPERPAPDHLQWIQARSGDEIRFIPIEDVLCFRADGKYTAVVTAKGESLITKPIKDLAQELDPAQFWRIHRGTIVNVRCIRKAGRSMTGRYAVKLNGLDEPLIVSRSYAHRFKQT
jgi:DNA-binding LytR/AlgR family response regulator